MQHKSFLVHFYASTDPSQDNINLRLLYSFISQIFAMSQHLSVEWNTEADLQAEVFCPGVVGMKGPTQIKWRKDQCAAVAIVAGVVTLGAVGPLVYLYI